MSLQFTSDPISQGSPTENKATQRAETLRQTSRQLRAASQSLQLRNSAIMLRADEVAMRVLGLAIATQELTCRSV